MVEQVQRYDGKLDSLRTELENAFAAGDLEAAAGLSREMDRIQLQWLGETVD